MTKLLKCLRCLRFSNGIGRSASRKQEYLPFIHRPFHTSTPVAVLKPFLLPDIGEGIKEVQIIQWFVEPEARVEQFDKLCEVQSDKAAAEITSRFDGVIKKLHYEAEDMAQVGKPLCDIDVMSEISPEDEATVLGPMSEQAGSPSTPMQPQKAVEELNQKRGADEKIQDTSLPPSANKHSSLATPAVRGLLKELKVNIEDIRGTGKDGRVLKEDVHRFAAARSDTTFHFSTHHIAANSQTKSTSFPTEHTIPLTAIQSQMFKTMTRSLQIPHFVYADEIDITALSSLRRRLNNASPHPQHQGQSQKLTYLPFILKAVSLALYDFPLLNARVDTASPDKPQLIMRASHNIGIAMDTPQGLLVPNIKSVNNLSIAEIAVEISRLQSLALSAKLTAQDLTGGTITVSNIGSIGGTYVSPVIVSNEVAILGIGKARAVPRFDDGGEVVRKEVVNFSWSADHRVVDGATMARCAERVRGWLEGVEGLLVQLR